MITELEVQPLLRKWQPILRLADWDIRVQIVTVPWRKSGDIKIDQAARTAVLMINQSPVCENLEQLIIHELMHLKLYGLDQMLESLLCSVFGDDKADERRRFAYDQFFAMLEPTVEDLAKSLLAASGNSKSVSFGRVLKQVDSELSRST